MPASPTAADLVDPAPQVSCNPPSGSLFPLGTTTVTCTATDSSGNVRTADFRVTVQNVVAGSDEDQLLIDRSQLTGTNLIWTGRERDTVEILDSVLENLLFPGADQDDVTIERSIVTPR